MKNKNPKEKKLKTTIYLAGLFLYGIFCLAGSVSAAESPKINRPDFAGLKKSLETDIGAFVDPQTGRLEFLSQKDNKILWKGRGKDSRENSRQFLKEFGKYFGVENSDRDLELLKETKDNLEISHLRYSQKSNGVPVFGGQLIVHLKNNQNITVVNGKINSLEQPDTTPEIGQKEATDSAKKFWQETQKGEPQSIGEARLYIYNKKFLSSQQEDDQNYLVWEVNLFSLDPYQHKIFYINAEDGSLVDRREAIKTAVDRRVYNCNAWDNYGDCVLVDTLGGVDHGRSEGVAVRGIADIDNLYDYTGSIHNYYVDTFTRQGANNQGGLGDNAANPFTKTDSFGRIDNDPYRGYFCPNNAYFEVNSSYGGATINFCDNSATKDIVGHEYGHGMSYFSILDSHGDPSGLVYAYESGALEEANADVFGEAAEFYMDGNSDWLVGEDIPGGPFRSMSDPASLSNGLGTYPDRFNSPNFYCGVYDGGGVHQNSTVVTHAAYLMAMGGTFNGCTVSAIGRAKEEAVFYRAITQYLTPTAELNDAYNALNTACADLYGAGSDCENVKKALRSVEMDQGGRCSGLPATAPQCDFTLAPIISSISSSVANGSYKAGDVIDIDVAFSEPVTSSGNVTVNLNVGKSCSFNVTGSSSGTCSYTVGSTDNTSLLNVSSVSGTLTDTDGNVMSNFSPAVNLSQNKTIIIDNTVPIISDVADGVVYRTDVAPTFNEGRAVLNDVSFASGQTISDDGNYRLVVTDNARNSSSVSFTVEKITSSVTSLPYTARKANRRIIFTVYGINLPGKLKARGFSVRLNGRKIKTLSVRNGGGYIIVNTRQNYRKWPAGNYSFGLSYNYKVKKTRYQGSAAKNNILTIQ